MRAACSTLASTSAGVCCSKVASTLPVVGFTVVMAMEMSLPWRDRRPGQSFGLRRGLSANHQMLAMVARTPTTAATGLMTLCCARSAIDANLTAFGRGSLGPVPTVKSTSDRDRIDRNRPPNWENKGSQGRNAAATVPTYTLAIPKGVEWELPYLPSGGYDELVDADGRPRPIAGPLWSHLARLGIDALDERQREADDEVRQVGLTFRTYEDDTSIDRPWPFDVIPRILDAAEWAQIEAGLIQRLIALNHFIDDAYHDQHIVRAGVVPDELVTGSPNFRPECVGVDVAGGVWAHICGSDLVRAEDGTLFSLEDNLRVPSGVSYVLENRLVAKHVFPELFRSYSVQPVDQYIGRLADLLASVAPNSTDPRIVVLTPGVHNSAYFEHAFLAQQLGVDLVEGERSRRPRRQHGLRQDHRRPGTGRRDLSPGRRRVLGPRGVPPGLGHRRARTHAGVVVGQRRHRPTLRAPASPTTRVCTPSSPR